jgi:hypothetical protein
VVVDVDLDELAIPHESNRCAVEGLGGHVVHAEAVRTNAEAPTLAMISRLSSPGHCVYQESL